MSSLARFEVDYISVLLKSNRLLTSRRPIETFRFDICYFLKFASLRQILIITMSQVHNKNHCQFCATAMLIISVKCPDIDVIDSKACGKVSDAGHCD